MKRYKAIINLNLFLNARSEEDASEQIEGEFADRLMEIILKDSQFDYEYETIQLDELIPIRSY
jgi:hypothetical protein